MVHTETLHIIGVFVLRKNVIRSYRDTFVETVMSNYYFLCIILYMSFLHSVSVLSLLHRSQNTSSLNICWCRSALCGLSCPSCWDSYCSEGSLLRYRLAPSRLACGGLWTVLCWQSLSSNSCTHCLQGWVPLIFLFYQMNGKTQCPFHQLSTICVDRRCMLSPSPVLRHAIINLEPA